VEKDAADYTLVSICCLVTTASGMNQSMASASLQGTSTNRPIQLQYLKQGTILRQSTGMASAQHQQLKDQQLKRIQVVSSANLISSAALNSPTGLSLGNITVASGALSTNTVPSHMNSTPLVASLIPGQTIGAKVVS